MRAAFKQDVVRCEVRQVLEAECSGLGFHCWEGRVILSGTSLATCLPSAQYGQPKKRMRVGWCAQNLGHTLAYNGLREPVKNYLAENHFAKKNTHWLQGNPYPPSLVILFLEVAVEDIFFLEPSWLLLYFVSTTFDHLYTFTFPQFSCWQWDQTYRFCFHHRCLPFNINQKWCLHYHYWWCVYHHLN